MLRSCESIAAGSFCREKFSIFMYQADDDTQGFPSVDRNGVQWKKVSKNLPLFFTYELSKLIFTSSTKKSQLYLRLILNLNKFLGWYSRIRWRGPSRNNLNRSSFHARTLPSFSRHWLLHAADACKSFLCFLSRHCCGVWVVSNDSHWIIRKFYHQSKRKMRFKLSLIRTAEKSKFSLWSGWKMDFEFEILSM